MYAAELEAALRADIAGLDDRLAAGDLAPALDWLRPRSHRRGIPKRPANLVAAATERAPNPTTLLNALKNKYCTLLGLD